MINRLLGRLRARLGLCDMGPNGHTARATILWIIDGRDIRLCDRCWLDLVRDLGTRPPGYFSRYGHPGA